VHEDLQDVSVWDRIVGYLLAVKESLTPAQINPGMLIIDDLGLDSLDLTVLAARIRADIGVIDFLPWLAQVTVGGGTVASLAEFVAGAQPERSDEGWPY